MRNVFITSEFLESFDGLPKTVQKSISNSLKRFQDNPDQSDLKIRPIYGYDNENLGIIRLNREYRIIVLYQSEEDAYVLTWVGSHEKADERITKKGFEINTELEKLHIVEGAHKTRLSLPNGNNGLSDEVTSKDLLGRSRLVKELSNFYVEYSQDKSSPIYLRALKN